MVCWSVWILVLLGRWLDGFYVSLKTTKPHLLPLHLSRCVRSAGISVHRCVARKRAVCAATTCHVQLLLGRAKTGTRDAYCARSMHTQVQHLPKSLICVVNGRPEAAWWRNASVPLQALHSVGYVRAAETPAAFWCALAAVAVIMAAAWTPPWRPHLWVGSAGSVLSAACVAAAGNVKTLWGFGSLGVLAETGSDCSSHKTVTFWSSNGTRKTSLLHAELKRYTMWSWDILPVYMACGSCTEASCDRMDFLFLSSICLFPTACSQCGLGKWLTDLI